jgi:hypothetical protein
MDFATILRTLQQVNASLDLLPGLVETVKQVREAWTADQQSEIDGLLVAIQAKNDQAFVTTDKLLEEASER